MRTELHPLGLEVVTVALDVRGLEKAGKYLEAAQLDHPSLIDSAHVMDELFGVVNVPSGIWIDEEGMIVRPPEPAFPEITLAIFRDYEIPEGLDPYLADVLRESKKIPAEPKKYVAALRDWANNGAGSKYALSADEVIRRARPRTLEDATAAAHFELGQHLFHAGHPEAAPPHWREAHCLQPDNWTYKRQAWSIADSHQGPTELYDGDWLGDVRKIGAENYYPPLEMD